MESPKAEVRSRDEAYKKEKNSKGPKPNLQKKKIQKPKPKKNLQKKESPKPKFETTPALQKKKKKSKVQSRSRSRDEALQK